MDKKQKLLDLIDKAGKGSIEAAEQIFMRLRGHAAQLHEPLREPPAADIERQEQQRKEDHAQLGEKDAVVLFLLIHRYHSFRAR